MPLQMNLHSRPYSGYAELNFNTRLQHTGSDYRIYANDGYEPRKGETDVLQSILYSLFADDAGVKAVKVLPFTLEIYFSTAISVDDLSGRISTAVARTQRTLIIV
jgi:hypothetical protein